MVYDCFQFFNELDILKIRLNVLDPVVDRFVAGISWEGKYAYGRMWYYEDGVICCKIRHMLEAWECRSRRWRLQNTIVMRK